MVEIKTINSKCVVNKEFEVLFNIPYFLAAVQPTCSNYTEEARQEEISFVHEVVALPTKG
jgi:hypothetical protein